MRQARDARFVLRLSRFERESLNQLADREGLSASAALRRLLIRALREIPAGAAAWAETAFTPSGQGGGGSR